MKNDMQERRLLYAAVWRWHFYAGLYGAPFLMLAQRAAAEPKNARLPSMREPPFD